MNFDQWPAWKRALFLNPLVAFAIGLGFASSGMGAKLSPSYYVHTGVFILAFVNVMFLAVGPRFRAGKAAGMPNLTVWRVFLDVVRERPLIIFLVVLQLLGVSRSATAAITFIQSSSSNYVRGLPNAASVAHRMVLASGLMATITGIWLLSAIGLWRSRSWAWWLALVLNGLAATVTAVVQLLDLHKYLVDAKTLAAVVLLLLPTVRNQFRSVGRDVQPT